MGSRSTARRERWFREGVDAFERVTDVRPPGYPCPLCMRAYPIEAVTLEHAPPRSMGGRPVTLTCSRCQSAGSRLEAELRKGQDLRELARGEREAPIRSKAEIAGIVQNVDVEWRTGSITVLGLPERNHPDVQTVITSLFADLHAAGSPMPEIRLTPRLSFNERHARIALLRAAYLVTFAMLGYRWAYASELQAVRDQIARPDEELIERFSLHREKPLLDRPVALAITRPRGLECIFVLIGEHAVLLPWRRGGLYERLAARRYWPLRQSTYAAMSWVELRWPTHPEHRLDGASTK